MKFEIEITKVLRDAFQNDYEDVSRVICITVSNTASLRVDAEQEDVGWRRTAVRRVTFPAGEQGC